MINKTNFESFISSIYDISYTVPVSQQSLFNYYVRLYKRQLAEHNVFNLNTDPDKLTTKRYDIPFCSLEYLVTPVWLLETTNTIVVKKINYRNGTTQVLEQFKDFWFEQIEIDEKIYVIGINFKCLSCNCECEIIEVTGKYGFNLTQELEEYIYNIIYTALKTGNINTANGCKDNIESERTGNYNVKYRNTTQNTTQTGFEKNVNNIYSFPYVFDTVSYYMKYFIKLY